PSASPCTRCALRSPRMAITHRGLPCTHADWRSGGSRTESRRASVLARMAGSIFRRCRRQGSSNSLPAPHAMVMHRWITIARGRLHMLQHRQVDLADLTEANFLVVDLDESLIVGEVAPNAHAVVGLVPP